MRLFGEKKQNYSCGFFFSLFFLNKCCTFTTSNTLFIISLHSAKSLLFAGEDLWESIDMHADHGG